ncbi:hypothetical protein ACWGGS_25460 [Streptomyces decoyicus]
MVAPGFRSRIATGLLVAAVVLPVPIGAASAAAADRRATPVDRPPQLARPGDQPEGYAQEEAGPGGDDFDGYGSDDYAADPRAGDGRGAGGRRGHHGHSGHPGAPGHLPELPPRFPGLPDAVPGFPHGPSHHHFGGLRGPGRWYHRPHHPFDPSFIGPDASRYPFPGRDDDVYHPRPGHHGPSAGASSPDADRAHPRPGRRAPSPKHHKPSAPTPHARDGAPARPSPSHRFQAADRLIQHPYEALPPLPTPAVPTEEARSAPDSADGESAATASPYAMEAPSAPVERVLPMGAGLALTGLGLAFFALRLRRS